MSKKVEGDILFLGANERKNIMSDEKEKNTCSSSKIILRIIIVIYSLLLLMVSLFIFASTIKSSNNLAIGNYKFYLIKKDNNKSIIPKGDLVIAKNEDFNKGDKIVYKEDQQYYCDNVENMVNNWVFVEKNGIMYQFSSNAIEGKIIGKSDIWGNIIMFLRAPIGIIIFLIFIILLFVILRILITKDDNI